MVSCAGLILAAGAGRRFGGPKAFAELPDGRTFLQACTEAHLAAGAAPIAATLPPDSAGPVPQFILPIPLPEPGLDMFASIRAGLAGLCRSGVWDVVVVHPVDHPLVSAATIAALAGAEGPATIPTLNGRHGHPFRLSRKVAEGILHGKLEGPTMREVLRAVGAADLELDDPGIRANCNTPETLAESLRKLENSRHIGAGAPSTGGNG